MPVLPSGESLACHLQWADLHKKQTRLLVNSCLGIFERHYFPSKIPKPFLRETPRLIFYFDFLQPLLADFSIKSLFSHPLRRLYTEKMQTFFHYESKSEGQGDSVRGSRVFFVYNNSIAIKAVEGACELYQIVRDIMRLVFFGGTQNNFMEI